MSAEDNNEKPPVDSEIISIADYVSDYIITSEVAYSTARYCLMDALGCALLALQYPACTKLLGPIVPETYVPNGARVPGTQYELDPILAAFNIGAMLRWLDFNDTWLAAEWGHPSDNLGAILAVADYVSRTDHPLNMRDVLTAMIKAYEIQGILALENSFNGLGIDHVILVKIASTAVATQLLGGNKTAIMNALSHAFIDGQALRTYRHAPNTNARKSWAAGDATSRAVRLSWLTMHGVDGLPSALSANKWGFNTNTLHGKALRIPRAWDAYVMENILFKISYPAEFHAQTAVECAVQLHPQIRHRLNDIDKIILTTQASAIRIISKIGPLHNAADRDHCLQYMVAVALLHGNLSADYYEDTFAQDPHIDKLRGLMQVEEDKVFSADYLNPEKRSIANAIQLFFNDGTKLEKIQIDYPLGHVRRRAEGLPLLVQKFADNLSKLFSKPEIAARKDLFLNQEKLHAMPVNEFIDLFIPRP